MYIVFLSCWKCRLDDETTLHFVALCLREVQVNHVLVEQLYHNQYISFRYCRILVSLFNFTNFIYCTIHIFNSSFTYYSLPM